MNRTFSVGLALLWAFANVAGFVVGSSLHDVVNSIFDNDFASAEPIALVTRWVEPVVIAASIGLAQWLVFHTLLDQLPRSEWVGHTTWSMSVGWLLPSLLGWGFRFTPFIVLFGAISGAVVGLVQSALLAPYVRTPFWWAFANSLAGAAFFTLAYSVNVPILNDDVAGALMAGLITGFMFAWLVIRPAGMPQGQPESQPTVF